MFDVEKLTQTVSEFGVLYGFKVLGAVLILIVGGIVIRMIKNFINKGMERREMDPTLRRYTVLLISVILWTFVILAIMGKFGIEIAPMIAGLGLVGFSIGFALQGSLASMAAGVLIILTRPFKVGDVVKVAGEFGSIHEIKIFSTIIATLDNQKIIVPNSKIAGEIITNVTAFDDRRIDITVGISYDSSIDKAKEVCLNTVRQNPKVLKEPEPMVAVSELADSSVNLLVRCWAKTADYWDVLFGNNENIKKALDNAGIEIPFPQRTVWMHSAKPGAE